MSNEVNDSLGPELLVEMQRFREEYPKIAELLATMVAAFSQNADTMGDVQKLLGHLEMGRIDHEWKLNTLKDLALRQMHDTPLGAADEGNPNSTIH